jgi:hypothetical protein
MHFLQRKTDEPLTALSGVLRLISRTERRASDAILPKK